MMEHGTFIGNELVTPDQKKSGDFYSQLFGWGRREVDAGPFGTYTIFQKDGRDIAGMMNPVHESQPFGSRWTAYVSVEDMDACIARATQLGASMVAGPDDVGGLGRTCLLKDPTGALIPLMRPTPPT